MREYETIYILRPEMGGDAVDAFNQRMKDIISASAGKVIRLSNWGKKKLAYRVKKCTRGIYAHILYVAEGKAVTELERNLRLSDHVIRHLSVLLNPEVDAEARPVEADVKLRGDGGSPCDCGSTGSGRGRRGHRRRRVGCGRPGRSAGVTTRKSRERQNDEKEGLQILRRQGSNN
jgi:small subunit ribosomal protein S6